MNLDHFIDRPNFQFQIDAGVLIHIQGERPPNRMLEPGCIRLGLITASRYRREHIVARFVPDRFARLASLRIFELDFDTRHTCARHVCHSPANRSRRRLPESSLDCGSKDQYGRVFYLR